MSTGAADSGFFGTGAVGAGLTSVDVSATAAAASAASAATSAATATSSQASATQSAAAAATSATGASNSAAQAAVAQAAAQSSATGASTSASQASTSASNAAASASAASTSATTAGTQASAASTSATNAAASATAAGSSATSAAASASTASTQAGQAATSATNASNSASAAATALSNINAAVGVETTRATTAEALLAPKANPSITGGTLSGTDASAATVQAYASRAYARTIQSKVQETVSILDWMSAAEVAASDITNALSRADLDLAAAVGQTVDTASPTHGIRLMIPSGQWFFSSPITLVRQRLSMRGQGFWHSRLTYTGTNAATDLITIGDGTNQITGCDLGDFRLDSNTTMTSGAALHCRLLARSNLSGISIDGQDVDGNGKLWDGLYYDGVDDVRSLCMRIRSQNTGLAVRGQIVGGSPFGADLYINDGLKISGCTVGIHVGGGFGGLLVDDADIIGNGTNLLIDNALISAPNRELVFGPTAAFDTPTNPGGSAGSGNNVIINQSVAASTWLQFTGTWMASGQHGLWVKACSGGKLQFTGGTVYNNVTGIQIDESNIVTQFSPYMRSNTGTALVNNGSAYVDATNIIFDGNAANTSGSVNLPPLQYLFTGTLNSSGAATVPHGIPAAQTRVLLLTAFYEQSGGTAASITSNVDGTNVNLTGGISGAHYRITMTVAQSVLPW